MRSGQSSDETVEGLAELKLTELESTNLQPPVALAHVEGFGSPSCSNSRKSPGSNQSPVLQVN